MVGLKEENMRNKFARLNENNASEIDEKIEQTYLSLQEEIKSVCKDKELMNHMFTEIDYIVYASKLYGGKRVMEKPNQRYRNKLMS